MATCDGKKECTTPITHIDERGFVYCTEHAPASNDLYRRRRKLRVWEVKLLHSGQPVPSYRVGRKPVAA